MDIQEEHGLMEADMTRETHMENEAENKEPALLEERLHSRLSTVRPLNQETMDLAWKRWDNIGKPLRSLGLLEKNLVKIAGIQETARPSIKKRALIAMCADNGVVAEGVTQTGWEVTAAVAQNMAADASSVAVMSDVAGVKVFPVDIGMVTEGELLTGVPKRRNQCLTVRYFPERSAEPPEILPGSLP